MTQIAASGPAEVRTEILATCREYVQAQAAAVRVSVELRPVVQARVLEDLTCAMMLEDACKTRTAARHVGQEARLFLSRAMVEAGLGESIDTFIAAAQRRALTRMGAKATVADLRDGAGALAAVGALLESIYLGEESETTCPTGLTDLDEKMNGGLPLGELTLLGAATGQGKTTFAMQVAHDAAKRDRGMVLVVSPEMQARDLWLRLAQRQTGFARAELRPNHPNREMAMASMTAAASTLSERSNLVLLDKLDADIDHAMDAALLLHHTQGPLYLLVLDYAQQLAKVDGDKARYLEVGKVAHKALTLAQQTNAAVLITSQVNGVRGKGGEIIDHTFRESQVLEQKAAVAIVMSARYDDGVMEFHMRKNRHGAMGKVEVRYKPASFTLLDMPADAPTSDRWERGQ